MDVLHYPKTVTLALLLVQLVVGRLWKQKTSGHPLPPGPRGYPGIGNLLDIPTGRSEVKYSELARRYGDMVYLESLGTKILVISSLKRTTELFEQKSSNYSDRADLPMICGQMGYEAYMSLMRYGSRWRRQRRLTGQSLYNPTAVGRLHGLILDERRVFVQGLLKDPFGLMKSSRSYFTRTILKATYGITPSGDDDPFITQPIKTVEGFARAGVPGTFLVDLIPALKYIPEWVPGTGWKKIARDYRETAIESRARPFNLVHDLYRKGIAPHSIASYMISNLPNEDDPPHEEERLCAQDATAIAYVDPDLSLQSLAAAMSAILHLAIHPGARKRAQEEIDEVVGCNRLPDFGDRPRLVYISAFLKEVFRMHPSFPLAVPHASVEDDIHDGYFIPKGTIVIGNTWHIFHDPVLYPDPFRFNPASDRFIRDGQINRKMVDPYSIAFGYGRRICPGRHMSIDSVFLMVASILAMFDINAPKDRNGNVSIKEDYMDGLLVYVTKCYRCQAI
ncbi:cytochrome P450 [Ephemerocybe angulata]|uniref:Cytochrome P450 n=1 Tax=Ephemerocybe angulata TaxID=980116 RepID=A0A8H6I0W6_9AGAR|nr:cytochrome P450 [Tulosesus angulatus]